MKQLIYIVIAFLLITGCKPGVPKDLIQPDEMAKVLHDIHITDAYVGILPDPDSVKIIAASYYKGIYKKYNIDSALYNKSMDYYYKNPKVLDEIYTKVTEVLAADKNAIVKADSIQGANEANKIRLKVFRDSVNRADSVYWKTLILKDTTKRKIDVIKPRLIFKDLRK
ncbi:DUF4296 domain-containing protein [Pedobacter frigoris]|uniref:DUF4296 domain-containing protein n=1 Tax=Pedobacter frigoris TaxID=2571272 RepID=A0A4U1CI50_9SPHI|nr:DUF4296 domain-containing protein [Pedobacter frigoris]TKC06121.1 DUF4296 domain-containing protein [Pedobacter frigoris]